MEFCQLGDLSFFIRKRDKLVSNPATADMARKYPNPVAGGLNEVISRHFLKQIASALECLRVRNLIHRDVKPQNLLLSPSAHFLAKLPNAPLIMSASEKSLVPNAGIESLPMLKIADFGFARSLPSTSLAETLCGSPLYMAPEILRYEKYDAKADLWSVGTVLFEMMTGKPPFRASNHVELLRKIEQCDDIIKFPKDSIVSQGMKSMIRGLLKRNPVERMSFENFFDHDVIKETIPGLVGDDRPREIRSATRSEEAQPTLRQPSNRDARRGVSERDPRSSEIPAYSSSPRDRERVQRDATHVLRNDGTPMARQASGTPPRQTAQRVHSNSNPSRSDAQGTRRPGIHPSATAPNRQTLYGDRGPVGSIIDNARVASRDSPSPGSSLLHEQAQRPGHSRKEDTSKLDERERAAQDVAFERDYVLVEKRAVEVNAFADEMAANPGLSGRKPSPITSRPFRDDGSTIHYSRSAILHHWGSPSVGISCSAYHTRTATPRSQPTKLIRAKVCAELYYLSYIKSHPRSKLTVIRNWLQSPNNRQRTITTSIL